MRIYGRKKELKEDGIKKEWKDGWMGKGTGRFRRRGLKRDGKKMLEEGRKEGRTEGWEKVRKDEQKEGWEKGDWRI